MIELVLHEIPDEYHEKVEQFLDEAPIPPEALRADLEEYLATVRQVAALVHNFRMDTLERLAVVALELLGEAGDDPTRRKLAQLAVRYLVEEEDDDEITGVLGLDDDREVVNAVARAFGRTDLVVPRLGPGA